MKDSVAPPPGPPPACATAADSASKPIPASTLETTLTFTVYPPCRPYPARRAPRWSLVNLRAFPSSPHESLHQQGVPAADGVSLGVQRETRSQTLHNAVDETLGESGRRELADQVGEAIVVDVADVAGGQAVAGFVQLDLDPVQRQGLP